MKNFLIVTFWSIVNKFLSLFRVQLTQRLLGTSMESDAFNLAFRMIGFFRRIFTDGSFYSFFTSYFAKDNKEQNDRNFGFVLGVLIVFSAIFIVISLLFFCFPLLLTKIFMMKNIADTKLILISQYAKYMFPMALSMFLCSIFSAILNYYGEFFHSSFGLVIGSCFNVTILYLHMYTKSLFWSFVLGTLSYSVVHAIYMGIILYKKYYMPSKPIFNKEFFKKISSTGIVQIVNNILFLLMGKLFFHMKAGGYSYVEYSERLSYFVFVLVAGNLSNIITPVLSKLRDNKEALQRSCEMFVSMTMFLVIFPTVFMFIKHDLITRAIYTATANTNLENISTALRYVSLGIPLWCFQRIFLTFFTSQGYLKQQNITTLLYNILTFAISALLYKYDFIGIILGMNISMTVVILYLLVECHRNQVFSLTLDNIKDAVLKIVISGILIKYVFDFVYPTGNMWIILIKAVFIYAFYCLFCYKDIKIFYQYSQSQK